MNANREKWMKDEPGLLLGLQFQDSRKERAGGCEGEACEVEAEPGVSGIPDVKWRNHFKERLVNCDKWWCDFK